MRETSALATREWLRPRQEALIGGSSLFPRRNSLSKLTRAVDTECETDCSAPSDTHRIELIAQLWTCLSDFSLFYRHHTAQCSSVATLWLWANIFVHFHLARWHCVIFVLRLSVLCLALAFGWCLHSPKRVQQHILPPYIWSTIYEVDFTNGKTDGRPCCLSEYWRRRYLATRFGVVAMGRIRHFAPGVWRPDSGLWLPPCRHRLFVCRCRRHHHDDRKRRNDDQKWT